MAEHKSKEFNPLDWTDTNMDKQEAMLPPLSREQIGGLAPQHEKAMQTLLIKYCSSEGHHPELRSFVGACNSIGIEREHCEDFLLNHQSVISASSSYYNNSQQLLHLVKDIYRRYASNFGKYKNEDYQSTNFHEQYEEVTEVSIQESFMEDLPNIPQEVYEHLPDLLKDACDILTDQVEKEVFLIGALGFLSGVMPNVFLYYDGHKVEGNLFVYITTRAGGGKGSLKFAYYLVKTIHEQKRANYKEQMTQYKQEEKRYAKKAKNSPDLEEPTEPPQYMLVIPANSSSTGAMELIADNDGRVIMFETEGDTLANTFKTDYGNYSDCFRKAFHHECISYYRRGDKEYKEIQKPCLSAIFSSTFEQLLKLIPSAENGLFSRFIFYEVKPSLKFKRVKDRRKNNYESQFLELGKQVADMYESLSSNSEIEIINTEEQDERFYEIFQQWKIEVNAFISEDLDGTVNRLGLVFHRIMMQFTVLRIFEMGDISEQVICSDEDFENAFRLVEVLKAHAIHIYHKIHKSSNNESLDSEVKRKVYEALPDEFKRGDVLEQVIKLGMSERSFSRFLDSPVFIRMKQGHYQKVKG